MLLNFHSNYQTNIFFYVRNYVFFLPWYVVGISMVKEIGRIGDGRKVQSKRLWQKMLIVQKLKRVNCNIRIEREVGAETEMKVEVKGKMKEVEVVVEAEGDITITKESQNEVSRLPTKNVQRN